MISCVDYCGSMSLVHILIMLRCGLYNFSNVNGLHKSLIN